MTNKIPNFFENRTEPWRFADVLFFIRTNFEVNGPFSFRIGNRQNTPEEHQGAGLIFAYAQLMNYNLNQIKALFSEHDHFAIAIPESRKGKNILEFNNIFTRLLNEGFSPNVKIKDFPELFDIPNNVLILKK